MDAKEINHIAKLARLKFDESAVDSMAKDLNDILKWMDILQSADTSSVTGVEEAAPLRQREDRVINLLIAIFKGTFTKNLKI